MTTLGKDIDAAFRSVLTEKVGLERFELWFGQGVRLEHLDGVLHVIGPDQFTLDWLRRKMRPDLESACRHVLGAVPGLEFRVEERPAHEPACVGATATTCAAAHPTGPACQPVRHPSPTSAPHTLKFPGRAVAGPAEAPSAGEPRRSSQRATLEAFVVGDSNRVAHLSSEMVLKRLGSVSPLFVYGPTGTGKTHLLEGIWNASRRSLGVRQAVLLSAEQFTTYFLEALRGTGLPSFRRKYRDAQLLLIDDVQFFGGKKATLVEVQHTVDTLLREGRQLVFAADRPPIEINGLGPELTARMSGGLLCGLEPPDEATRFGILRQLAGRLDIAAPEDVLRLLAGQLHGDARQLQGAMNRLDAMSQAHQRPITTDFALTALADIFRSTQRLIRLPDIEKAICGVFGLEPSSLQSDRKEKAVSHPRMLAMWLARRYTRAAFSEIGEFFGRRSHSTVISAEKKVSLWMEHGESIQLAHAHCPVQEVVRRVETILRTG